MKNPNMKKLFVLLLALSLILSCCISTLAEESAEDPVPEIHTSGSWEYVILPDGTASIVRFTDFYYEGELVIPDTLDGIPVTVIGDEAFIGQSSVSGVSNPEKQELPTGYFEIEQEILPMLPDGTADYDNYEPKPIEIPIIEINFEGSLPAEGQIWEYDPNNIVISDPNDTQTIMFNGDSLPFTFEDIDWENLGIISAEEGDHSLISVIQPGEASPDSDWMNGTNTSPVNTVSAETSVIPPSPFSQITGITIPEGVTHIGTAAFPSCTSLTSVILPESLVSIGHYAFEYCESLSDIVLPDSVADIGHFAFIGCRSLRSINIPDSAIDIGSNPFASCNNLEQIILSPSHPNLEITDGMLFSKPDKRLVSCLPLSVSADCIIPDGTEIIGAGAFENCASLVSVSIPDSVTTIGNDAFKNCTGLTDVVIPDSVSYIGNYTFAFCASLREVTIPGSVEIIRYASFAGCESLAHVRIMNGVNRIRMLAFCYAESMEKIEIPESVTMIDDDVFDGCYNLTAVVVPGSFAEEYCREKQINCTYINNHD